MAQISWRSQYVNEITSGDLVAKWSADGFRILRYYIDFSHGELALHREVSAPDIFILQNKVDALVENWDRKYAAFLKKSSASTGREAAEQATIDAGAKIASLSTILHHTLGVDDRVDWEKLKDHSKFVVEQFKETRPRKPASLPNPEFVEPKIGFWDRILGTARIKRSEAESAHLRTLAAWQEAQKQAEDSFAKILANWEARRQAHLLQVEASKDSFYEAQREANDKVDQLRLSVVEGDAQAVIEQMLLVLEKSDYDDLFEKEFEVDYDSGSKTLFVDYELPAPDDMPVVKSVKFVPSTGELSETYISDRDKKQNFDSACFQIALRTIHEVLEADEHHNVSNVSFNGYATYVDRATGRDVRSCIMSALVKREEFETFDLARVDPKVCFKSLKGVSASSLAALAPVAPVIQMNRTDRRFVEARDAASDLTEATNLAAMDWEEFEHLVRQLFEKEFQSRGGEVHITQASRDGGVDAVAFDPDPITGGKIVIQAKRYTRTVGVSAVRDLYGTIMNEGASRGILVTTADYGPDAHTFANGKPITLFSGSHLLHMLEKHGYKAKIDVGAARRLLGALSSETY